MQGTIRVVSYENCQKCVNCLQLSITEEVGLEGILLQAVFRDVLQVSVEDMTAIHAITTVFALGEGFPKK